MFFEGGVWKTNKWRETFIWHLWYLVEITEIKIQSSAVAVNEVRRCVIESPVDEKKFTI